RVVRIQQHTAAWFVAGWPLRLQQGQREEHPRDSGTQQRTTGDARAREGRGLWGHASGVSRSAPQTQACQLKWTMAPADDRRDMESAAAAPVAVQEPPSNRLFRLMVQTGASDLHLSASVPPLI